MTPRISVIVPVYNVAEWLEECLDSILNQTFQDLEVICVNDGSTDNSPDILKEYAAKDSRITIIHQENKGLSEARNTGMKVAKGDYILFVDSDDYIAVNLCELAIQNADSTGADMIMFEYYTIDNGKKTSLPLLQTNAVYTQDEERVKTVVENNWSVWKFLWKTSFLRTNHLHFIAGIHFEDVPFSIKAAVLANKLATINASLYYYRIRETSITNINKSSNFITLPCVFRMLWHDLYTLQPSSECMNIIFEACINNMYWAFHKLEGSSRQQFIANLKGSFPTEIIEYLKENNKSIRKHVKEFYYSVYGSLFYKIKCKYRSIRIKLRALLYKNKRNI
ncbi:MAG: glycosyltransferase [Planctomycetia bacterium]|nr:glycosyltransferase [Planctomycetia bacterium]